MTGIILEVALTAMCAIIGGGTLYILKGIEKKQETLSGTVNGLLKDHSALAQRVADNEHSLRSVEKDINRLEADNKALLVQINDNYQKIQISIEELKLRNAELTAQFKQADITHSDIKGDIARIAAHLYGNKDQN